MKKSFSNIIFKNRRYISICVLVGAVLVYFLLHGRTKPKFLIIGFTISLIGIALRMYSASFLKGRHIVTTVEAEYLCTSGPFAYIRNPLYVGHFIIGMGLCTGLMAWYLYLIYIIKFIVLYSIIIPHEERFLDKEFGKDYLDYKTHIRRFIPTFKSYHKCPKVKPNFKKGILKELYYIFLIIGANITFYFLFTR